MAVSVVDVFKRFDAYPKTLEDFRIKTFSGGTITVIRAIVMILLFASEIQDYLTPGTPQRAGGSNKVKQILRNVLIWFLTISFHSGGEKLHLTFCSYEL